MKIYEVIRDMKDMPLGTVMKCKQLNTKYELEKHNEGKKHFGRILKGTKRFSSLIDGDYDFEIVHDEVFLDKDGLKIKYANGTEFSSTISNQSIIQIPKLILDNEERLIGDQHTYKTRILDRIMIKRINDLVSEVNELRRRKINE